jgi:pyrimidine operon attenuation protein/uracil phosphoribosyltransferase
MSTLLMNADEMNRAITRIAHEILEKNKGTQDLALVGIRTRGVVLANRLRDKIKEIEKTTIDIGILDITLYRDDLATSKDTPVLRDTDIPFAIDGKKVVLCDDVLFTGRTIRAAIDALVDFGRPAQVQLAVLIDRGHRELPFRPDYVGKNIPTSKDMRVKVQMTEEDKEDQVIVINDKGQGS